MGCVTSFQDVKIIPAFMQILDKAGVNYGALGEEETCCGYLAYLVGDMKTFKTTMAMHDEQTAKYKPKQLITSSAGCLKTFRDLYPHYGGGNGYTVLHAVEFIEKLINDGQAEVQGRSKAS